MTQATIVASSLMSPAAPRATCRIFAVKFNANICRGTLHRAEVANYNVINKELTKSVKLNIIAAVCHCQQQSCTVASC